MIAQSIDISLIRKDLDKYDIIKVSGKKYLILCLKKDEVELLPIDIFLEGDASNKLIPKFNFRYETLYNYQKIDNTELLYLLNENNSFIKKALNYFFYERK